MNKIKFSSNDSANEIIIYIYVRCVSLESRFKTIARSNRKDRGARKSEKARSTSCNGSSENGRIALIRRVGAIFIGHRARKLIHPRISADYRLFAPTGWNEFWRRGLEDLVGKEIWQVIAPSLEGWDRKIDFWKIGSEGIKYFKILREDWKWKEFCSNQKNTRKLF